MSIQLENFCYTYPHHQHESLKNISCRFEAGSFWCIAGANGSGKSTLFKAIAGLLPNASLEIRLKKMGWIEKNFSPAIDLTIQEFIIHGRYGLQPFWKPYSNDDEKAAMDWINNLDLKKIQNKRLSQISSGELQRCLLARALVQEADVLLIDEGLSQLDLHYQAYFLSYFQELYKSFKKTILLIHHDLNTSLEFCPNFLWLKDGSILAQGAASEITTTELIKCAFSPTLPIRVDSNPFEKTPHFFFLRKH